MTTDNLSPVYALKVTSEYREDILEFVKPTERFAPTYGPVTEHAVFGVCLEDWIQNRCDGRTYLPSKKEPWVFLKGNSEEDIRNGLGEEIVTLHSGDAESLWKLYEWAHNICTGFRIVVSY